jgi:uncharacterized protein with NRDE domain
MCTLIAAVHVFPSVPLVIAANRDERTLRPASPPSLWPAREGPRILAPRDEEARGTWLGLNHHGLFVGITNRAGISPDPTRRSRGALVVDALRAPSALALGEQLKGLAPDAHNPFHLLYADRETAGLTYFDGQAIHHERLGAGLHIITERSLGDRVPARAALVHAEWREIAAAPSPSISRLIGLLSQHADDPFAGTCVHADAVGYGTRSAMILILGQTWASTRMLWAEGRPCVTPFRDQGALLDALAGGVSA